MLGVGLLAGHGTGVGGGVECPESAMASETSLAANDEGVGLDPAFVATTRAKVTGVEGVRLLVVAGAPGVDRTAKCGFEAHAASVTAASAPTRTGRRFATMDLRR